MKLYGVDIQSRLLLGTAGYPSPTTLAQAVQASRTDVVTVSLRRESSGERAGQGFWSLVRDLDVRVLPNTDGCHSVKEAVTTAHMAREVFGTSWIKLEVIGEDHTLQPDVFGLVEAARILSAEGFQVFPYTTEDSIVAERLLEAGCEVLMPWGAPIGSGRGLNNRFGLKTLRARFPDVPLIVDAGIGVPSHAAQAVLRFISPVDVSDNDVVVDLRSLTEAPNSPFASALRAEVAEIESGSKSLPQGSRIVLCCRTGVRAWRAARALQHLGHSNLTLLALNE